MKTRKKVIRLPEDTHGFRIHENSSFGAEADVEALTKIRFYPTRFNCAEDYAAGGKPTRRKVLEEAADLIDGGQRNTEYGPPDVNHQRIADLWTTFLEHPITPAQAATMMLLVKVARLVQTPGHRDSYVDIAGYAGIGAELTENG